MTLSAKLVLAGHAVVVAVHLGAGAALQEVGGLGARSHLYAIARIGKPAYGLLTGHV